MQIFNPQKQKAVQSTALVVKYVFALPSILCNNSSLHYHPFDAPFYRQNAAIKPNAEPSLLELC